jgi:uncharacterized protein with HEPN domain
MPRDYKVYLEDVLQAIGKIRDYTTGMSRQAFMSDSKTLDAVVRNLEVIGEAAKKVPKEIQVKNPQVEWRKIASLRDILIHEYFGVDREIVWDIVENKLPVLVGQVNRMLELQDE